jgi:hypothetical protein
LQPAVELAHIRQCCHSMNMPPSALTELEKVAMDVLHWTINMCKGMLEWAQDAATQCERLRPHERVTSQLLDAVVLVAGCKIPLMGYAGKEARKLLLNYEHWLQPLWFHPLYHEMLRVFRFLSSLLVTLWTDWEGMDATKVNDFALDMTAMQQAVVAHFTIPGSGCTDACVCSARAAGALNTNPIPNSPDKTWWMRRHGDSFVYFPVFKNSLYFHYTTNHVLPFMQRYGSLMKYSSIVLEHANAIWKAIIKNHVPVGKAHDQAHTALSRFLLLTHPEIELARESSRAKANDNVRKRRRTC